MVTHTEVLNTVTVEKRPATFQNLFFYSKDMPYSLRKKAIFCLCGSDSPASSHYKKRELFIAKFTVNFIVTVNVTL